MLNIIPDYLAAAKEDPNITEAMSETYTVGGITETALSPAFAETAALIIGEKDGVKFQKKKDGTPSAASRLTADQLTMLLDARTTVDLLIQMRGVPFRQSFTLSMNYSTEAELLIDSPHRYDFDELDWGYTEQPFRMVQAIVEYQGSWPQKKADLLTLLKLTEEGAEGSGLEEPIREAEQLLAAMEPEEYHTERDAFDKILEEQPWLMENFVMSMVHRWYLKAAEQKTIMPAVQRMTAGYCTVWCMAWAMWKRTGKVEEQDFIELVRRYTAMTELSEGGKAAMEKIMTEMPIGDRRRLLTMIWN